MDIPELSMVMSQTNLQNAVQLTLMNKVINTTETTSAGTINMINGNDIYNDPYKGQNIDATV